MTREFEFVGENPDTEAFEKIDAMAKKLAYSNLTLRQARYVFNAVYIGSALKRTKGNVTEAANVMGVGRLAVYRMMKSSDPRATD